MGTVYLVGAGPGDPGLVTRRAARLLRRADVVIHDALVTPGILALIGPRAARIDVGKRCRGKQTAQSEIHRQMIEAAGWARVVVRLKGGDPFVFGRGGEEALALRQAGIPFRVVPGVTAGIGAAAHAGIPVTHRGLSGAVTFVTGHEDPAGVNGLVDWEAIGRAGGTLVIYMGVSRLRSIVEKLIAGGRAPTMPAAVVEWGTCDRQRTIAGTLEELPELVETAGVGSPAVVVVGEVVALREELNWFDPHSVRGVRVLIGRSRPQPSRLARSLAGLGAEVTEFPALRATRPADPAALRKALRSLPEYRWVVFASATGVDRFREEMTELGLDARALAGVRFACAGTATASALGRFGVHAEVTTRSFDAETVIAAIERHGPIAGTRMIFPRSEGQPSRIALALRERGADIEEVAAYRVEEDEADREAIRRRLETGLVDVIVLSSSTVARRMASSFGDAIGSARVVAIGPETAQVALACGLPVHSVPAEPTLPGIVRGLFELLGSRSTPFPDVESGAGTGRTRLAS